MIKLKKTKEWSGEHKEEGDQRGSVHIYVGSLHCGVAYPTRVNSDMYFFHADIEILSMTRTARSLEEIKLNIELTLKEFASKFVQ